MKKPTRPGLVIAIVAIAVVLILCLVSLFGCTSLLGCVTGTGGNLSCGSKEARAFERVSLTGLA